ncbi:MAG: hypothetical protein D3908_06430, partial [Candidatus Electrothrix sp. AUS4]|nr:hypothetical protein [Candidatus Electrothrix sp. AUS4]
MMLNNFFFKYGVYFPVVLLKTSGFIRAMRQLDESQYYAPEQIEQLQLDKARKLLHCVKKNNTIYKELFSDLDPESIVT